MKRTKTLKTTATTDGIWDALARLLALDSSAERRLPEESPPCMGRISAGWSQEVLGEWLWLHNSATTWGPR